MVLMAKGMTFTLHHSFDLGDVDGMGEDGTQGGLKFLFHNFTPGHSTLI